MYRMGEPTELRDAIGRTGNTTVLDYDVPTALGRRDENIYGVSKPKADAWALRKVQIFCVILLTLLVISSVTIGVLIHTLMQRMNATEAKSDELQAKINKLQDNSGALTENDPLNNTLTQLTMNISANGEEVQKLHTRLNEIESGKILEQENGVTYVRWGRSVCPADSEKVYTGYVGGGHYQHSGSGANWLCLTDEPQYGYHEDNTDTGALVYGGEYEFGEKKNGGSGFFGQSLTDLDALCVVCRPPRPSVVMIPGRNTCYGGWRMEYSGYLVGEHWTQSASNFICLDSRPEPRKGSHTNTNGKLFFIAAGICGALPCPPYVNGRQLTCVVCSK